MLGNYDSCLHDFLRLFMDSVLVKLPPHCLKESWIGNGLHNSFPVQDSCFSGLYHTSQQIIWYVLLLETAWCWQINADPLCLRQYCMCPLYAVYRAHFPAKDNCILWAWQMSDTSGGLLASHCVCGPVNSFEAWLAILASLDSFIALHHLASFFFYFIFILT